MESSFPPQKQVKTYGNPRKAASKSLLKSNNVKNNVIMMKRVPLTTKKATELLLNGKLKREVCRYCLHMTYPLSELDQIMQIAGNGALYKVTIRDIMASFHPFKMVDDPNFPSKICERCLNRATHSYLFAQQCEQSERALRNCFDDVLEKLDKLDPLEQSKRRGRQKLRVNHNLIRIQHHRVIDYAEPIRNLINVSAVSLTDEPQIGPLECKKCWQVLPNVESLANHEKIHPKSMWYHCRLCGKSYVKKYQMNRHIKLHAKEKIPNFLANVEGDKDSEFVCKQCGHASESYDVHLQHIETHKFKMVMEHVVERKMDKLCSVCLDKNGTMVGMDKMISLHGGYPELTGDRNLYNILGATVPEPNYKYQELQISQKANIMTITKKVKKCISNESTGFHLSLPLIISEKYEEMEKNVGSCSFLFSVPLRPLPDKETNDLIPNADRTDGSKTEPIVPEIPINFIDPQVDQVYTTAEKEISNVHGIQTDYKESAIQFSFSNPEFNIDVEELAKRKKKEIKNNRILCNICWIFNKPNCKRCIEDEVGKLSNDSGIKRPAIEEKISDNKEKPCQYCWLFQNVGKCEHCKQNNEMSGPEQENTADTEKDNNNKAKRKFDSANVAAPKKSKWLCKICLVTNNIDRETCICCECKEEYNNTVKVNFDANKNNFFDFMNNSPEKSKIGQFYDSETDHVYIEARTQNANRSEIPPKVATFDSIELPTTEMMDLSNSQTIPLFESVEPMDTNEENSLVNTVMPTIQENVPFKALTMQVEEFSPLATPNLASDRFSIGTTPEMSHFLQQGDIPTFSNIQFHMGSAGGSRKFKKPLRRIATTSHK